MFENDFYFIEELESTENSFNCRISLNSDHIIFQGHFPGYPVVPGVVLIQMVTEILGEAVQQKLSIDTAPNIKFLNLIEPGKYSAFSVSGNYENVEESIKLKARVLDEEVVFCKLQATFRIVGIDIS